MSKQGKLKEEITDTIEEAGVDANILTVQDEYDSYRDISLNDKITYILDEANKEFPECQKCSENEPMKPCSFMCYATDFPTYQVCTPLKGWRKKWFGEVNKK